MVNKSYNNLLKRTLSAIVLGPASLIIIYYGGAFYNTMISIMCLLMLREWYTLALKKQFSFKWLFIGIVYCITPCYLLFILRNNTNGLYLIFWLISSVWATDIGAYFTGCALGGPKIAPKISPKKTWAGLLGAEISTVIVGYLYQRYCLINYPFIYLAFLIPIISQLGDFLESAIKRHFNVKDSGNIIPGHGGILDRIDGLITSIIFISIVNYFI